MIKASKYLQPTARVLLARAVLFMVLFSVISAIVGIRVMNYGLFFRAGFEVYGVAGKALIFAIIVFGLTIRGQKLKLKIPNWNVKNTLWIAGAFLAVLWALIVLNALHTDKQNLFLILQVHLSIIASAFCCLVGCFGLTTLRTLFNTYKKEILLSLGAAAGFLVFLEVLYSSWEFLASFVLVSVRWLMDLTGINVTFVAPYTLLFSKFGITIEQGCSGIESIALFSGLYAIVGFLDWDKLNHKRFLWLFPAALVILMICNILRVYLLILGGYFINKQIAFSLFHTYAGMVFFILYSAIFWHFSYKWMLKEVIVVS